MLDVKVKKKMNKSIMLAKLK